MPSKRAKLSHPSPEDARPLSDEEDEEVVDVVEEDPDEGEEEEEEEEEEEVIEELEEEEGEEDDEQQDMGNQEGYAIDDKQETEADNADNEEVEEEEEDLVREVIEEEEEDDDDEEEVEVEDDEEEVEEEGAGVGETERGELEEEEVDAEYEDADETEEVEHVGDHDVDSRDEDAADVEEDVEEAYEAEEVEHVVDHDSDSRDEDAADVEEVFEEANGAAGDAEEDDEADEDAHDADDDADEDAHDDAVEDVDDADEDDDDESGEQLAMEEDDDDDGDGEDDDDDDDDNEELVAEDGGGDHEDAEDEHRKQLAILMCFSSLQSLMAMELCRDVTPPFDEIGIEGSTTLPGAFLKLMLLAVTSLMQEEGRQCWKLQRPGQEWTHIERGVSSTDAATRDSIWRRKYSMSYACFLYLVEELRPFIQSESQMYVRAPLEIERAVAMVLYRFAHGLSAREVAEKYNVGASTVGKYTLIVASALAEANKLYGRYVTIPTGERMARIISQFQQITNVSHMCGAIDGTHIKLYFKPDKWYTSSTSQNTHKSHSILLQAVCDANKLFWDVCCMAPGGAHDAAHFIASNLYQNIKDGLSLQEPLLALENKEVTPYMVGDSAYPIRPFLIKPFDTDDGLRRAFDEQLRKGSTCIDGAFEILKTRWKILKCMNVHLMHAPRIAIACCVLHNICQLWGEPEPPQQQMKTHSNDQTHEQTHRSAAAYEIDEAAKIAGEAAREALFRDWVKRSLENPRVSLDQENMFSGQN